MSLINTSDGLDIVFYEYQSSCDVYQFADLQQEYSFFREILPQGKAWNNKYLEHTNLGGFVSGVSKATFGYLNNRIERFVYQSSLLCATRDDGLLDRYIEEYGGDDCFDYQNMPDEQVRKILYYKSLLKEWATKEDLIFLIKEIFDIDIDITPACSTAEGYDYAYDHPYNTVESLPCNAPNVSYDYAYNHEYIPPKDALRLINTSRYVWYIDILYEDDVFQYDYAYDHPYQGFTVDSRLKCLLNKLKPANTILKFRIGENEV